MRFLCENMELVAFDKDIGDMFLSPWEDSDAKITVEGITFHVYSIVVSMTSVFLKRKLADSTTKEITLNDVEWPSMAYVLRMMYPQYELNLWTLELKTLNQMLRVCENLEINHPMRRIENHLSHMVDLIFLGIGDIHFPQLLSIVDKYEFQESILKCTLFTSRTYPFYTGELKKICEELEITTDTKNKIMINIARRHLKEIQKEMDLVEEPQKTLFCVGKSPQDEGKDVKMKSLRQKSKEYNLTGRRKADEARNSTLFDLKPVDAITKPSYDLNVSSDGAKPGDTSELKSRTSKEADSLSNILKSEQKIAGPINETKPDNLSGFDFFGKLKSEPDKKKTETNKQSGKFAAPTNDTKSDILSGFSFGKPKSESEQRKTEITKPFGKLATPTNDTKYDNLSGFSFGKPKSESEQRKTEITKPFGTLAAPTNDTKSDILSGFSFGKPKSESEQRKTEITKPFGTLAAPTNDTKSDNLSGFNFGKPKSESEQRKTEITKPFGKLAAPTNDTKSDILSGFNFEKLKSESEQRKTEIAKPFGKLAAPTNDTKSDNLSGFNFGKPKSELEQRKTEIPKSFGKLAAPTNDTKSNNLSGFSFGKPKSELEQKKTEITRPFGILAAPTNNTISQDNFGGSTINLPKSEAEQRKTEITKPTVKFAFPTNYTNSRSFREFRFNIPKSEPNENVSQPNDSAILTIEEKKRTLIMKRLKDLYCIFDCISKESLTVRFLEEKLEKININNDTKSETDQTNTETAKPWAKFAAQINDIESENLSGFNKVADRQTARRRRRIRR